jgi:hypothetical protein
VSAVTFSAALTVSGVAVTTVGVEAAVAVVAAAGAFSVARICLVSSVIFSAVIASAIG